MVDSSRQYLKGGFQSGGFFLLLSLGDAMIMIMRNDEKLDII